MRPELHDTLVGWAKMFNAAYRMPALAELGWTKERALFCLDQSVPALRDKAANHGVDPDDPAQRNALVAGAAMAICPALDAQWSPSNGTHLYTLMLARCLLAICGEDVTAEAAS